MYLDYVKDMTILFTLQVHPVYKCSTNHTMHMWSLWETCKQYEYLFHSLASIRISPLDGTEYIHNSKLFLLHRQIMFFLGRLAINDMLSWLFLFFAGANASEFLWMQAINQCASYLDMLIFIKHYTWYRKVR